MTIAKLALADQGTTAEVAVTCLPGAFTVLWKGKRIYVNVMTPGKLSYLDVMGG